MVWWLVTGGSFNHSIHHHRRMYNVHAIDYNKSTRRMASATASASQIPTSQFKWMCVTFAKYYQVKEGGTLFHFLVPWRITMDRNCSCKMFDALDMYWYISNWSKTLKQSYFVRTYTVHQTGIQILFTNECSIISKTQMLSRFTTMLTLIYK